MKRYYEKYYDYYVNLYGKSRDSLKDVLHEVDVVQNTPDDMIGGIDEKVSILLALYVLEEELRKKFNAFGSGKVF